MEGVDARRCWVLEVEDGVEQSDVRLIIGVRPVVRAPGSEKRTFFFLGVLTLLFDVGREAHGLMPKLLRRVRRRARGMSSSAMTERKAGKSDG